MLSVVKMVKVVRWRGCSARGDASGGDRLGDWEEKGRPRRKEEGGRVGWDRDESEEVARRVPRKARTK